MQGGEGFGPAFDGSVECVLVLRGDQAHDVVQTGDRGRVAARVAGSAGDDPVEFGQPLWWHVGCGHRPAVGLGADELDGARPEDAEPQADVVRGPGARPGGWYLIVGALVAVGLTGPAGADDVDGLTECAA